MAIDSSGNVLVGKTASNVATAGHELLDYGRAIHTVNASTVQILNRNSNDGDMALFMRQGAAVGSIGAFGGYIYTGSGDTNIRFHAGVDAILPANAGGASRSAAIDLGVPAALFKDLYLSGSVYADLIRHKDDTDTYIQWPGNNQLAFNTGGTERARLDSNGNLGLGVVPTNFTSRKSLDIGLAGKIWAHTAATETGIGSNFYFDGAYKRISANPATRYIQDGDGHTFDVTASGSADSTISWDTAMTIDSSGIDVTGSNITLTNAGGGAQFRGNAAGGGMYIDSTGAAPDIIFRQTGAFTERMRISGGNLLVGRTSPFTFSTNTTDGVAILSNRIDVSNASVCRISQLRDSTGTYDRFYNGSSIVGSITGTTSATAYNTSSDYRLKEDDVAMTGSIERVKALRPINFAWKADGSRVDGFFAHEAQEVVPEAVHGSKDAMRDEEYEVTPAVEEVRDEDGKVTTEAVAAVMGTRSVPDYQGIDQSKLVPLLVAAMQEQQTLIESLTTRIAELEE
jgi:hypothetical protein